MKFTMLREFHFDQFFFIRYKTNSVRVASIATEAHPWRGASACSFGNIDSCALLRADPARPPTRIRDQSGWFDLKLLTIYNFQYFFSYTKTVI